MALDLRLPQTRFNRNDADEQANRMHTSAALLDYHSLGHIRAQLTGGRWQRPHRVVVVTHNGAFTRDQQVRVTLASGLPDSAVAGLSALGSAGGPGPTSAGDPGRPAPVSPGPVDKRFGRGTLAGYPQAHSSTQ